MASIIDGHRCVASRICSQRLQQTLPRLSLRCRVASETQPRHSFDATPPEIYKKYGVWFIGARQLWSATRPLVTTILEEARVKIKGRPFKRATTWNKYLDSISDTKLQELGLTREVLELTRYSRDHLQHEVEGSYDDLPISSIASAVLNWAPGYQALFKFMYGQDPGAAAAAEEDNLWHIKEDT